jgi:hypothetical protein
VLVEHLLDLPGVDVVAAPDDQVLLAVHDVEIALGVDPAHVAAVEPAVADRLGGGLGPLPVALHHVRPLDHDLAHIARRDLEIRVVHDAHPHPADRRADRAGLALPVGVVERGDRRGLRQPVPLEHRDAERLLETAQHLDGQGRAAGDADPQRGGVIVGPVGGMQQRHVHGWHALEDGHPVLGDDPQRLLGREPRQQGQARPGRHRDVERDRLPEHMEQRQPAEDHVVRARADDVGARHLGVADQVAVSELGTLRPPGRAGGVQDHRGVLIGTGRDLVIRGDRGQQVGEAAPVHHDGLRPGLLGAAARLAGEHVPGEDKTRPGIAQVIGHLPHLEQRVHRDDHPAGPEHAVVHHGNLGDVRHHDPDPVPGLDAPLVQQPGHPGARLVQCPVRHRRVADPHGHPPGVGPSGLR